MAPLDSAKKRNGIFLVIVAARIMMVLFTVFAFFSINQLKESFEKDLDYMEDDFLGANPASSLNV